MKFYYIKDEYIEFLKRYDTAVSDNKHENRPYVGIVLEIHGIKYYSPFTSPKEKYKTMKNGKDFRKIHNGEYGAINFNNMIPVLDSVLIPIVFDNVEDKRYRRLLKEQYRCILAEQTEIRKTASELRALIFSEDRVLTAYDRKIKARCCNLPLLESDYQQYENR